MKRGADHCNLRAQEKQTENSYMNIIIHALRYMQSASVLMSGYYSFLAGWHLWFSGFRLGFSVQLSQLSANKPLLCLGFPESFFQTCYFLWIKCLVQQSLKMKTNPKWSQKDILRRKKKSAWKAKNKLGKIHVLIFVIYLELYKIINREKVFMGSSVVRINGVKEAMWSCFPIARFLARWDGVHMCCRQVNVSVGCLWAWLHPTSLCCFLCWCIQGRSWKKAAQPFLPWFSLISTQLLGIEKKKRKKMLHGNTGKKSTGPLMQTLRSALWHPSRCWISCKATHKLTSASVNVLNGFSKRWEEEILLLRGWHLMAQDFRVTDSKRRKWVKTKPKAVSVWDKYCSVAISLAQTFQRLKHQA